MRFIKLTLQIASVTFTFVKIYIPPLFRWRYCPNCHSCYYQQPVGRLRVCCFWGVEIDVVVADHLDHSLLSECFGLVTKLWQGCVSRVQFSEKERITFLTFLKILHLGTEDNVPGFFLEMPFQALLGVLQVLPNVPAAVVKILQGLYLTLQSPEFLLPGTHLIGCTRLQLMHALLLLREPLPLHWRPSITLSIEARFQKHPY